MNPANELDQTSLVAFLNSACDLRIENIFSLSDDIWDEIPAGKARDVFYGMATAMQSPLELNVGNRPIRASRGDSGSLMHYRLADVGVGYDSGWHLIDLVNGVSMNISLQGPSDIGADTQERTLDDSLSGWNSFTLVTLPDHTLIAATADHSVHQNEWNEVKSWLSASDVYRDATKQYQSWDEGIGASSGYFWAPDNPHNAANRPITVAASNLDNVCVWSGQAAGGETMWVRAFDGTDWNNWDSFTFTTVPNHTMVATISDHRVDTNEWTQVKSSLSVSDADGDAINRYQFWDGTGASSGGFWTPDNPHISAGSAITVAACDLNNVWLRGGQAAGSKTMWVCAFDDTDWSVWDSLTYAYRAESNSGSSAFACMAMAASMISVEQKAAPDLADFGNGILSGEVSFNPGATSTTGIFFPSTGSYKVSLTDTAPASSLPSTRVSTDYSTAVSIERTEDTDSFKVTVTAGHTYQLYGGGGDDILLGCSGVGDDVGSVSFTTMCSSEIFCVPTTQTDGPTNSSDYVGLNSQAVSFAAGETLKTVTASITNNSMAESNETFGLIVQRNASDPVTTFLAKSTFADVNAINSGGAFDSNVTSTVIVAAAVPHDPTASGTTVTKAAGESTPLMSLFSYAELDNEIVSFAVKEGEIGGGYLTRDGTKQTENALFDKIRIGQIGQGAFVAGPAVSTSPIGFNAIDSHDAFNPSVISTVNVAAAVAPKVTIADASVTEGGLLSFSLSLDKTETQDVTVSFKTTDGTVATRSDYTAKAGSVIIRAHTLSATVTVQATQDSTYEHNETLQVQLTSVWGGNAPLVEKTIAAGTILDDDPAAAPMNRAPKNIMLSKGTIAENSAKGTIVGALTAADEPARELAGQIDLSNAANIRATAVFGTAGNDGENDGKPGHAANFHGTVADNRMFGAAGNDTLSGQAGQDVIVGRSDSDRLIGGIGNDCLIGGTGNDRFVYSAVNDQVTGGFDQIVAFSGDVGCCGEQLTGRSAVYDADLDQGASDGGELISASLAAAVFSGRKSIVRERRQRRFAFHDLRFDS